MMVPQSPNWWDGMLLQNTVYCSVLHHRTPSSMLHGGATRENTDSERHCGWNQKSQICPHQNKQQIPAGLISILCVYWLILINKLAYLVVSIQPWRFDSLRLPWAADAEACMLLELWEAFMWPLIWGAVNLWFLRLEAVTNCSSWSSVLVGVNCDVLMVLENFVFLKFLDWLTFMC